MKKIALVMAVHDQTTETEQNLPRFLTMPCETDYEVIVVDDSSADETPELLKQLKADYPRLYTTFLPKSVIFNPSRLQLALSVGVKAATKREQSQESLSSAEREQARTEFKATKSSWIVLTDITRPPVSDEWLQKLTEAIDDRNEVLMAYSGRKGDKLLYQTWDTLEEAAPLIRKAERRSRRGHRGKWQKFRRGVYDAVAVRSERVHDAIRLFDQHIRWNQLIGLRLKVFSKNLF